MSMSRLLRLTALGVVGAGVLGFAGTVALGKLMTARGAAEIHSRPAAEGQSTPLADVSSPPRKQLAGTLSSPKASVDVPPRTITPAASQRKFVKVLSVAKFARDTLELCTDTTLEAEVPLGAPANWEPTSLQQFNEAVTKDGILLRKTCAEQFSDRKALASCVATLKPDKGHSQVHFTERYYNFATFGSSDSYLEGCLRLSGEWQALSRGSPEFRKARQRAALADAASPSRSLPVP